MLEKILIKNYLLLKDIEINFSEGFNVITGETGAGKSILINALSLLLGERADYSIISRNKDKMIIEGIIRKNKNNKKEIESFLKQSSIEDAAGGPDENFIILRRELYTKGYSRSFVNDSPVNVNDLKLLGDTIVDIHSQNEHQSLLKKEIHIELLDSYLEKSGSSLTAGGKLNFKEKLENYRKGYAELKELDGKLTDFYNRRTELENKRSFLEFQLKEIKEADPKPNEDDELEKELKMIENVEVIQQGLSSAYDNLYEDSGSALERIKGIEKELDKLKEFNPDIPVILKDITNSITVLDEASRQINILLGSLSYDPVRIESIRERLYKLQFIKKKYGGSLDEVIKLKDNLEKDLSLLDNFDDTINKLEKEIKDLKEKLFKEAEAISKIRKENSQTLEKEVVKVLKEVGFENAEFKVETALLTSLQGKGEGESDRTNFKTKEGYVRLSENGIDDVELLVKINKGDEFSSLRKTASGGEISRIMLALKTVLADADKTDVLVFDEIDIGISGRIAQKVGKVLKKLSSFHQLISITHLAQIAALGDEHFLVEKETTGNSTITKIRKLEKNEKVIEVAKLLSGEKVTDASIKSAKELIGS
jgi:DNA repair protein RecN (Recombination protein N)